MSDNQITLDDLNYFWMPNGAPCFMADRDDICDVVEAIGFSIYYVLGNLQKVTTNTSTTYKPTTPGAATSTPTTTTTQTITKNAQLFKVVNNFVGRSVAPSTDPLPDQFVSLEENCVYNLPLIPFALTEKLDEFFRLVHTKHGTESIVLLTFDPSKDDSSGWGILVPEQTNTAAHCSYDAESVVALKPDDVFIVGSVHSHPDMPAYASGTDHADQADFDGIHITYGWQKSVNNGATQYYAELQLNGSSYKMDIEDIFEFYTLNKEPDPEVVDWSDKVKKALPPTMGGTSTTVQQVRQALPHTPQTETGEDIVPGSRRKIQFYKENVNHLSVEPNSIIVAEVYINEVGTAVCPSCDFDLDDGDFYAGYCSICDIPIAAESSSINSIARNVLHYCKQRSLSYDVPSYLWGTDNSYQEFLIKLNLDKALSNEFYGDDDIEYVNIPHSAVEKAYEYEEDFSPYYTVCCGVPVFDKSDPCDCDQPILFEDYTRFDQAVAKMNLYVMGSDCFQCQHYYSQKCPSLVDKIRDYTYSNFEISAVTATPEIDRCEVFSFYEYQEMDYDYIDERYG